MKKRSTIISLFIATTVGFSLSGQLLPEQYKTLLPESIMDEIIGECSGEMAMNHLTEMSGYNRDRQEKEFATTFLEAEYVLDMLKVYGISDAKIERFPGRQVWDGIKGELWEISPNRSKIADYDDLRAVLASGSQDADVEAELVWIGEGNTIDIENADVEGKIVVTNGSASRVHNAAVDKGAVGVISMNTPRPLKDPLQIPWRGIRGGKTTFAFNLSAREGELLKRRLLRGEKIKVHAVVESEMRDYELQDPTAVIYGSDPDAGEIIFSAHLFEGYTKQGANDNISGCAVILDVARTLNTLIEEGRIPKPKRNIRFLWVPEFSGTGPWVNAHKDLMAKTLCNINLDMVGLHLSKSGSFFCLMRTTFGNPHYLNDVMEHYYRYVGETNREMIHSRSFTKRIVAPTGSDDPFYYKIDPHYGASDHEVFNDWGIQVPGIMMITWPDLFYHTSEDRPYNCDPTQLKRAAVIAAAAAYTIAGAEDDMAVKIAAETFSHAGNRMGIQFGRAIDELTASTAGTFAETYKRTRSYIEATIINEKETLNSIGELIDDSEKVSEYIKLLQRSVQKTGDGQLVALEEHMKMVAASLGVNPVTIQLTNLEKEAETMIPKQTKKVLEAGYRGHTQMMRELPKNITDRYPLESPYMPSDLPRLANGKHTVLDIKKMLDTQYSTEYDLQSVINYLERLKYAGLIEM
jgi:hypothetical protein